MLSRKLSYFQKMVSIKLGGEGKSSYWTKKVWHPSCRDAFYVFLAF
ncbi:hypothetical protein JOD02_001587 [Caldicoprobacter guelmensis]|nr:hypothetical protein [Caldicoprobacter guelmensis]MBM7582730.1 hypothetical protein [Caldicoprobacter guelmensis]